MPKVKKGGAADRGKRGRKIAGDGRQARAAEGTAKAAKSGDSSGAKAAAKGGAKKPRRQPTTESGASAQGRSKSPAKARQKTKLGAKPKAKTTRLSPKPTLRQRLAHLKRDAANHVPHLTLAGLCLLTLGAYAFWASGGAQKVSSYVDTTTRAALIDAGLAVEEVFVHGRRMTRAEDLRRLLDVEKGQSILHVDVEAARETIEALGWVRAAQVRRTLPNRLHVFLTEEKPFAVWQNDRRLFLINTEGGIIDSADMAPTDLLLSLPHVTGEGANVHAAALLSILEREPEIGARLKAAERLRDRRWDLHLKDGKRVRLPETGVREAIEWLADVQAEYDLLSTEIPEVDLRTDGQMILKTTEPESGAAVRPGRGSASAGAAGAMEASASVRGL